MQLIFGHIHLSNIVHYNDFGQVAYQVTFTDATEGVFLYTPDLHWRAGFDRTRYARPPAYLPAALAQSGNSTAQNDHSLMVHLLGSR